MALPAPQIHPSVAEGGAFALHFEHPTKAEGPGGWMNRKEDAETLAAAEVGRFRPSVLVTSRPSPGLEHVVDAFLEGFN